MVDYKEVSIADVKTGIEGKETLLVDTRDMKSFSEGHIRSSINIPFGGNFDNFATQLLDPKLKVIVVGPLDSIELVSEKLVDLGFDGPIGYFKGGIDEWKA